MLRDGQTTVWSSAALTATALSAFSYDTGALGGALPVTPLTANAPQNSLAEGEPMCFCIVVLVAPNVATGDETYEFDIVSATTADLGTNLLTEAAYTWTNARATTDLTAGKVLVLPLPPNLNPVQRYLGLKYIAAGTNPSITVTAWLTSMAMVQTYRAMGSAIVIL